MMASTLVLEETGSGARWEIRFEPDVAWFSPPHGAGEALSLSHRAFAERVTVTRAPKGCQLVLRTPGGPAKVFAYPLILDLPIRAWMRRELDVHVAGALAKRVTLGLPIALFVVASALPWGGTATAPLPLVTGAGLLVLTVLARIRPRLWLILLDAVVWLALALTNARDAVNGSWFSAVVAVVALFSAYMAIREWRFFRDLAR